MINEYFKSVEIFLLTCKGKKLFPWLCLYGNDLRVEWHFSVPLMKLSEICVLAISQPHPPLTAVFDCKRGNFMKVMIIHLAALCEILNCNKANCS